MKGLNKTIHAFTYRDKYYELDWLTGATCLPDEMVVDIFNGKGKIANYMGQIIVSKKDSMKKIERIAKEELSGQKQKIKKEGKMQDRRQLKEWLRKVAGHCVAVFHKRQSQRPLKERRKSWKKKCA